MPLWLLITYIDIIEWYVTSTLRVCQQLFLFCYLCGKYGKYTVKRNDIQKSDAIIYAFSIRDHCMGSRLKMYDDRQFCNGHRTVTMGVPVGYLISGNYSEEEILRMILEGRAQVGGMKFFRNLIYQMQGMMKADYKFFKKHGQFDFPQKKKGTIVGMYLVGAMLPSPLFCNTIASP